MINLTKHLFTLWTKKLLQWLTQKFDSISIDLTPVEDKLDEVKGDVADVKTAVEHIDFSTVAKQGTNPNATNTAILAALQSSEEETPEELPAGLADRVMLLLDFFGITAATEYTALTPAEAIAIARDCQYNVMGTDWPIPTWLPTGVTEAQVESAAEGLGIPYHEPTQTA